jgi:hypothetical protein
MAMAHMPRSTAPIIRSGFLTVMVPCVRHLISIGCKNVGICIGLSYPTHINFGVRVNDQTGICNKKLRRVYYNQFYHVHHDVGGGKARYRGVPTLAVLHDTQHPTARVRHCGGFAAMNAARRIPQNGWSLIGVYPEYTAWQKGAVRALSSLIEVEDEHLPLHHEWLVSFSQESRRPLNNKHIEKCLQDFGAIDFMEDNHERGIARKFWLAVDPKYRIPCPCKDEMTVNEGDYSYSVVRP